MASPLWPWERKPSVASGDRFDHAGLKGCSPGGVGFGDGNRRMDIIATLAAAADGHDATGDKARLVTAKESGNRGDLLGLRAIPEGMDLSQILFNTGGIRLRVHPFAQRLRPDPRRANRVDANALATPVHGD